MVILCKRPGISVIIDAQYYDTYNQTNVKCILLRSKRVGCLTWSLVPSIFKVTQKVDNLNITKIFNNNQISY